MASKVKANAPRAEQRVKTVLLVEDDASVAKITTVWLRALGFEVIVCADGRQACDLAGRRHESIDLLLADVMLPGLRGPVLAEILRGSHPEMAVLFSSGYSPELLGEMFASHIESALLLYKPYDAGQLASRVHLALTRKAASRREATSSDEPQVPDRPQVTA